MWGKYHINIKRKERNMGKTARDIMTGNVIVVEDDMSINNLAGIFLEHKISCAPVMNKKKQLVGIVTKNRYIKRLHGY